MSFSFHLVQNTIPSPILLESLKVCLLGWIFSLCRIIVYAVVI